tara:strand:- start:798 stop:1115 length:318 start_codon:yes stop_codon:yes gene_type:complete
MKNFKIFIFLNIILYISSCGTVKEGFTNQKKNNSDEFLVEKKSPLVMPPDFDELPIPKQENINKKNDTNDIKSLISKKKSTEIVDNEEVKDKSLEDLLLKKIKNN